MFFFFCLLNSVVDKGNIGHNTTNVYYVLTNRCLYIYRYGDICFIYLYVCIHTYILSHTHTYLISTVYPVEYTLSQFYRRKLEVRFRGIRHVSSGSYGRRMLSQVRGSRRGPWSPLHSVPGRERWRAVVTCVLFPAFLIVCFMYLNWNWGLGLSI